MTLGVLLYDKTATDMQVRELGSDENGDKVEVKLQTASHETEATMSTETALRDHLVKLLTSSWAHVTAEDGIAGVPPDQRGARLPGYPHTIWQLLEHLRICQDDLAEYSRDANHISADFPEGYWPESDVPEDEEAWEASVMAFKSGLQKMVDLVSDPSRDLFEAFPWSEEGHTLLREALILADHNSYHVGQIVQLKKALGVGQSNTWQMPEPPAA